MGRPLEDIRLIAVPPEDAALSSAIAELDRKLSEYAAAVRQIAARLHGEPDAPRMEATSAVASPAESQPELPPAGEVRKHAACRLTERAPKAKKAAPQAESHSAAHPPVNEAQQVAAGSPAPEPAALTDEEALLASLDEPTAKAVRVLRRLNPQKSVQELLKQVESHPHEQPAKHNNKAWFRFGR